MKKSTIIILGLICILVGGFIGYGLHGSKVTLTAGNVTSPAGSTFGTAKFYGVAVNLANPGANGTSTTLVNTDATDRFITSTKVGCEGIGTSLTAYAGAGLSSLQLSIGTTTSASPITFNTFAAVALNLNLATTTTNLLFSSTTIATATSSNAAVWHSGENLTFYFNATNTAACTVGVDVLGS